MVMTEVAFILIQVFLIKLIYALTNNCKRVIIKERLKNVRRDEYDKIIKKLFMLVW